MRSNATTSNTSSVRAYLIPNCSLQSHKCVCVYARLPLSLCDCVCVPCRLLRCGTDEHEYFRGLAQRKFNALLCNQISSVVFPLLRFKSQSKPSTHCRFFCAVSRSTSSPTRVFHISHVHIWWGVVLSGRSAGASGPHSNELGRATLA